METSYIGDPNTFAIQYRLRTPWPPSGYACLWIHGKFIGDISRDNFLYHMCYSLNALLRREDKLRAVYSDSSIVPDDEHFFSDTGWTWGDSFDDFFFQIYAVKSERSIHFLWELENSRSNEFPGYPLGRHHDRISFEVFDQVVTTFLGREELARALRN